MRGVRESRRFPIRALVAGFARAFVMSIGVAALVSSSGCFGGGDIPDQSQFAPLDELATSQSAVARVYAAPIPFIAPIAVHCWFVVKPAGSQSLQRWEVFHVKAGTYGHVFQDAGSPTDHVGAGGTFVVAELTGPAAEPVVEFIQTESPDYTCNDFYVAFPGPNSNSYVQWVLDGTGWDLTLPARAIGKDVEPNCP